MILTFTIEGNQEDIKENPIPYLRMTRRGLRLLNIPEYRVNKGAITKRRGIKRYLDWKDYVRVCFITGAMADGKEATDSHKKEILNEKKVHMDCMIWFANKRHGDPDNIRKGIQDALFSNDKYVVGSVDYQYDTDNPRVEVSIKRGRDR